MRNINNCLQKGVFSLSFITPLRLEFRTKQDLFWFGKRDPVFCCQRQPIILSDARVCTDAIRHDKLSKRDLAATHTNRGIILAAGGNLLQALEDHNQAAQLKADLSKIYINRGTVFHRLKEYKRP